MQVLQGHRRRTCKNQGRLPFSLADMLTWDIVYTEGDPVPTLDAVIDHGDAVEYQIGLAGVAPGSFAVFIGGDRLSTQCYEFIQADAENVTADDTFAVLVGVICSPFQVRGLSTSVVMAPGGTATPRYEISKCGDKADIRSYGFGVGGWFQNPNFPGQANEVKVKVYTT